MVANRWLCEINHLVENYQTSWRKPLQEIFADFYLYVHANRYAIVSISLPRRPLNSNLMISDYAV